MRSKACPVCQGENHGRWTCPGCTELVNVHRELLRSLQAWHSFYASGEVDDVLVAPDGRSYGLWDVDLFYEQRFALPQQQRSAVELCLYHNIAEKKAAVLMGVSPSSPVSIYATVGLSRLLGWVWDGTLTRYRLNEREFV